RLLTSRRGYLDERALELEVVREPRAALECVVELSQADGRVAQLLGAVVARLRVELLHVEGVHLQAGRGFFRRHALGLERLHGADAGDVVRERADKARDRPRARIAGALEHAL